MNFLPLVIWTIGFLFVASVDAHWKRVDGIKESQEDAEAVVKLLVIGFVVFLVLGFL